MTLKHIFFFLLTASVSLASDITTGTTFVDGQRITASQLMNIANNATINSYFYTSKFLQTNLNDTDILLVYVPSSGAFHKMYGSVFFNNAAIVTNQQTYTTTTNSDLFLGFDSTTLGMFNISLSNLIYNGSGYINPGLINYSNRFSDWPYTFVPNQPTNIPSFIVINTNGTPYSQTLSNLALEILPTNSLTLAHFKTNIYDDAPITTNLTVNAPTNTAGTNVFVLIATSTTVGTNGIPTNTVFKMVTLSSISNTITISPGSLPAVGAMCKWIGTVTTNQYASNLLNTVNVSNVVHLGTGNYRVEFTNSFLNTNYVVQLTCVKAASYHQFPKTITQLTNSMTFQTDDYNNSGIRDSDIIHLLIYP